MNLIHTSAIYCSATLLPLHLISCLFANCFDNIGEAQNNFSGPGRREGSGATLDWGQAVAGLSRAVGQTLALGHDGQLHRMCPGGEGDVHSPPSNPLSPSDTIPACQALACCRMDCVWVVLWKRMIF